MLENIVRKVMPSYGYSIPDHGTVAQAFYETRFTPDAARLEEYEYQLIFVCDEHKRDHFRHKDLGEDKSYFFPAFTLKTFDFWHTPVPFLSPVPLPSTRQYKMQNLPPASKIKGEVYAIRPQTIINSLDPYYQNTVEYQRARIKLIVPYRKLLWLKDHTLDPAFGVSGYINRGEYEGSSVRHSEEHVALVSAWMYIGRPEFWDPLITHFNYEPVEFHHSKNRRWLQTYYNIRRPELPTK